MYCTTAPSFHCRMPSWTMSSRSLGCAPSPKPKSALQKLGFWPLPAMVAIVSESECGVVELLSSTPTSVWLPEMPARNFSTSCRAELGAIPPSVAGVPRPSVNVSQARSHGAFASTGPPPPLMAET